MTSIPAELGLALPREQKEPAEFFPQPRHFAVRPGTLADQRLFKGDSRILSREGFTSGEAAAFAQALAEVTGDVVRSLKNRPELFVLFQHDLLRVAERLMASGRNPKLLKPISAVEKRLVLISGQIFQLPSTFSFLFPSPR